LCNKELLTYLTVFSCTLGHAHMTCTKCTTFVIDDLLIQTETCHVYWVLIGGLQWWSVIPTSTHTPMSASVHRTWYVFRHTADVCYSTHNETYCTGPQRTFRYCSL